MLLGVSGSYGYGTNREGSDIDFRGVALNLPSDMIGLTSFDQYEIKARTEKMRILLSVDHKGRGCSSDARETDWPCEPDDKGHVASAGRS